MNRENKNRQSLNRKLKGTIMFVIALLQVLMSNTYVYAAESISSSKLATGTEKLVKDATSWLLVFAPIVTIVVVVYFLIRRGAADEMDVKKWNNRITTALISCILAVVASATLNVLIGYYS